MNLLHVREQVDDASKGFFAAGTNLVRGQHEAIAASVAQLCSKSVVGIDYVGNIVDAATSGRVNGRADGTVSELSSVYAVDGVDGTLSERLQLAIIGWVSTARVSIRCKVTSVGVSEDGRVYTHES